MAKKERTLSPAEQELSARRIKLEAAEKANTEKPTDKTAAALDAAKAAVTEQNKVVNRERFVRVGGGRAKKAIVAIRNLANVAAPRSYTYDESDVAKAETALKAEVEKTIAKMRSALTSGGKSAKADDGFTF